MLRIILILLLLICSNAEAKRIIVASCQMGEGCTFRLSEPTAEEIEIVMGYEPGTLTNLPSNAMLVFANNGSQTGTYIERRLTRSQLDKFYGGDGFTQLYLFDPRIQPLNGVWQSKIGTVTASECMVDIGSILGTLQGHQAGGNLVFTKPFTPRFLMDSPEVKWIQLEPNKFKGILNFGQTNSPMQMTYLATIVHDRRIEGVIDIVIKVPTKAPCSAKVPIIFECVKPDEDQSFNTPENTKPRVDPLEDDPLTPVDILTDADDDLLDINNSNTHKDNPNNTINRLDEKPTKVEPLNDADGDLLDIDN